MRLLARIFRKTGKIFFKISGYFEPEIKTNSGSSLMEKGTERDLFLTKDQIKLWLGNSSIIDQTIIETGYWEPETTRLVKDLVKKDDVIIDIGANIGYYSIYFSRLTGSNGKVYAFEPTKGFNDILVRNLKENAITNVTPFLQGFSDRKQTLEIKIDDSSATIHQPINEYVRYTEKIDLTTVDSFVAENNIDKIDFIKIDIDGHEPFVLEGAISSIKRFKPIIIMEVSHLHYLKAGVTAWDFYNKLKEWGFRIYSEGDKKEIRNQNEFLIKCGNFCESSNIILSLDRELF